jgi:TDG/mug DNA glycosylase family protein
MAREVHPFPPLFDSRSEILILGSFPSVRSRETGFFYGHPQNRFWLVLAALFGERVPETIPEKKALLLARRVALWDVIASCEIAGSSDASIRGAVPNDLRPILAAAPIRRVFCNGGTSFRLYGRYQRPLLGRDAVLLPSTSPANAAWRPDDLVRAWSVILE